MKVTVTKELDVVTYAEHWHTAACLLDRAKTEKKGSYHQYLACITFVAFSLEAFLNHLGSEIFSTWVDLEPLNPRGKINIIAEKLKIDVDYGAMPWQIVPEIVAFRNKVAHGKNETLSECVEVPLNKYDEHLNQFLKAKWQQYATLESCEKTTKYVEALCKIIWLAAGHDENMLFSLDSQSGNVQGRS